MRTDLGFPIERVPPPLAAYSDQVITIGSLSKVVWGGLRIGWLRAPAPVVARLARLRAVHDLGGNIPAQLAAADLLAHLDAPQRRGAAQRQTRHDHLRAELARHLTDWQAPAVRGGQTLWVHLPHGTGLDADGHSEEYVHLHFLAPPDELSEAVRRLAGAWRSYDAPPDQVALPPTMLI